MDVPEFDLRNLPPGFYDDPYPTYRLLRETAPVFRMPDGGLFLSRYEDVLAVYKDPKLYSSDKTEEFFPKFGDSPLFQHHTTSLVFNDPPLHTRVRKLLMGALSPKAVERMQPGLVARVDALLERAHQLGEVDLIEHFAAAIPIEIIGNLLDVPHEEREPLRDWSLAILSALEPAPDAAMLERGNQAVTDFLAYLSDLVRHRRAHPGNPEVDVLTRLIEGEIEGARLTESELLHNCIFILNAGHETTTNLIGNALVSLQSWPKECERLCLEPELARTAVDEFLRFESPNQLGNRLSRGPSEIGGLQVPAGTRITLGIGAANRDPSVFAEPERLDLAREPNRHLAFGSGGHQCAGMMLARLEGRIAVTRFLERFPRYRLSRTPVRGQRARFRGFVRIPCVVEP